MSGAAAHKESYYQAKILEFLRKNYPGAFIWKCQQGPYSRNGIPDICMILDGHFFGFEVKKPDGKPSKIQEITIRDINRAGGTALIVIYPVQVQDAIEKWRSAQ